MSRFRNASGSDSDEGSIDISPLIDVVFILLIFFIVTTTFVEESGLEVDRPRLPPLRSKSPKCSCSS